MKQLYSSCYSPCLFLESLACVRARTLLPLDTVTRPQRLHDTLPTLVASEALPSWGRRLVVAKRGLLLMSTSLTAWQSVSPGTAQACLPKCAVAQMAHWCNRSGQALRQTGQA